MASAVASVGDVDSNTGMLDACFEDGTAPEMSGGLVTKAVAVGAVVKSTATQRKFMVNEQGTRRNQRCQWGEENVFKKKRTNHTEVYADERTVCMLTERFFNFTQLPTFFVT